MIVILQRYIFRELFRAFLLTVVALTAMLGFGGGVKDLLMSQGITADQMVKLLIYLLPVVLTYALPVAALFSTTITYGRFSSDNEINACRASGINIHKLLIPAFVLSIIVTVLTFGLENFVIPDLAERTGRLVKGNLQSMAEFQLRRRGYLAHMGRALHADRVDGSVLPKRQPDGTMSRGHIQLSQVTFLEQQDDVPVRYGTARSALIFFDYDPDGLRIDFCFNKVRMFDEEQGQMVQFDFYTPDKSLRPPDGLMDQRRVKFLPLPMLLDIARDPMTFKPMTESVAALRGQLREAVASAMQMDEFRREGEIRLLDADHRYAVTADELTLRPDGQLLLQGNVKVVRNGPSGVQSLLARSGSILAVDRGPGSPPAAQVRLRDVRIQDTASADPNMVVERPDIELENLQTAPEALSEAEEYTDDQLLDPDFPLDFGDMYLANVRDQAIENRARFFNQSMAEINTRLAYSSSALVLLILGAGLGIIFRGGHFVSAFGLSFIPMLAVVVMIVTGKQISRAGDPVIGSIAIWSGLALVIVSDVVILGKFLKR